MSLPPGSCSAALRRPSPSASLPPVLRKLLSSPNAGLTLFPLNVALQSAMAVPVLSLATYMGQPEAVRLLLGEGGWTEEGRASTGRGRGWCLVDGRDDKGGTALMCE